MFDEAITSARGPCRLDLAPRARRARGSTCGESGFAGGRFSQTIATSPRVSSSTVSFWSTGVGLRVGEEALAGLLAEPALGDEAAQERWAARSRRPTRASARSSALEHRRRAPRSSARANGPGQDPGAHHHPELDVLGGGDALLEHEAGLDERLQPEALDDGRLSAPPCSACRAHRSPSRSSGRGCPASTSSFISRRHVEAVAVRLVQVLGDVQDRVEPEQVGEEERAPSAVPAPPAISLSISSTSRPSRPRSRARSPTPPS